VNVVLFADMGARVLYCNLGGLPSFLPGEELLFKS
jgi:hypothetical protein